MTKKKCKWCKEEFIVSKHSNRFAYVDSPNHIYCSKRCCIKQRYFKMYGRYPKEVRELECPQCNISFETSSLQQKHCSKRCCGLFNFNKNKERILKLSKKNYLKNRKYRLNVYNKKYYEENKDVIKEQSKKYNLSEIGKLKRESYNFKHKEKLKKYWKKHNIENKLKKQQQHKEWYNKKKEIENIRRKNIGLPLIKEGFKREMELIFFVKSLFSGYSIKIHERTILNRLELDIYLPELRLAFEYQGQQHYDKKYHSVLTRNDVNRKDNDFEKLLERDGFKKELCKQKGIVLIEIRYDERLSEQLILSKIIKRRLDIKILQKMIGKYNGM